VPPWAVVLAVDLVLVVGVRRFPWRAVPIGTAVAVGALAAVVGAVVSPDLLDGVRSVHGPFAAGGVTLLATVAANLVNNIPATLLMVNGASEATTGTWAWLLGVNLGAVLVPIGALANLLWLRIVREEGLTIGWRRYVRSVAPIALPALAAAIVVQGVQLALTGR